MMRFLIFIFSLTFAAFAFSEMNLEGRWKRTNTRSNYQCVLPEHLENAQEGFFVIKRKGRPKQSTDGQYYGYYGGTVQLIEWRPESAGLPEGVFKCPVAGEASFRGQCAVCKLDIRPPEYDKTVFCSEDEDKNIHVQRFYTKENFIYILPNYQKSGVCKANPNGRTGWILKKRN